MGTSWMSKARTGALIVACGAAFAVASPTAAQCAPDGGADTCGSKLVENVAAQRDQVAATSSETGLRVTDGGVPVNVEGLMAVAETTQQGPRLPRFPTP